MKYNISFTIYNEILNVLTFITIKNIEDRKVDSLFDDLEEMGYIIDNVKREVT